MSREHDYVINCTGYDPLEQLRRCWQMTRRRRSSGRWAALGSAFDPDATAIGRSLELEGVHPSVHVPGLAAVSQGPGFSTLGALGLLADRVLEPLTSPPVENGRPLALRRAATPPVAMRHWAARVTVVGRAAREDRERLIAW